MRSILIIDYGKREAKNKARKQKNRADEDSEHGRIQENIKENTRNIQKTY